MASVSVVRGSSTACSSSATLGVALDWIRLGRADVVIAGGTIALHTIFAGYALAQEPCRPFGAGRG